MAIEIARTDVLDVASATTFGRRSEYRPRRKSEAGNEEPDTEDQGEDDEERAHAQRERKDR